MFLDEAALSLSLHMRAGKEYYCIPLSAHSKLISGALSPQCNRNHRTRPPRPSTAWVVGKQHSMSIISPCDDTLCNPSSLIHAIFATSYALGPLRIHAPCSILHFASRPASLASRDATRARAHGTAVTHHLKTTVNSDAIGKSSLCRAAEAVQSRFKP